VVGTIEDIEVPHGVTIAPDGRVKRTRVLGGHPVLATDTEVAAQKTTFEAGPRETVETMEFKF